jgi:hypothetical protein
MLAGSPQSISLDKTIPKNPRSRRMPEKQDDMTAESARGRPEPRLPKLKVTDLTPGQLVVYDAITVGRRAAGPRLFRLADDQGGLEGPFNAMLYDHARRLLRDARSPAPRVPDPRAWLTPP